MPLQPGQTLVKYRLVEIIGEGAMGVVWRAQDTELHREVALKVLPESTASDPRRLERFRREARAVAALNHPNIVTLYSVESERSLHFLTMELVEGESLEQLLPDEGLPAERLLDVAIQLAEALSAAHAKGITHRDLKPANIMVTGEGRLKVLDFGVAKLLEITDDVEATQAPTLVQTEEGAVVGTVAFMSPEQAKGQRVDHRSDLFSMGIILYSMATGTSPFEGDTPAEYVSSILRDHPAPVSTRRTGLSPGLDAIVDRCLEKDPDRRWGDAGELRDALVAARDRPGTVPSARMPRSRRVGWMVAVAAFVAVVALALWGIQRSAEGPTVAAPASRSAIAILPFSVRGTSELAYLREGMVNLLSTKLDGAGDLRSVDPRALLSFTRREGISDAGPEDGRRTAQHFGAGLFVLGDLVEVGGNVQISASLYEGTETMGSATVEGSAEQLLPLLDDLATELLLALSDRPGARVERLAAVTTSSLPALKAYLEGESRLRAGDFEAAVVAFQRATEEDDQFALAFYRLSVAAEWALLAESAREAAERASELSGRLSGRDRQLLQGFVSYRRGMADQAERHYRSILGSYPDDLEAWFQLGEVLFHYNPRLGRSSTESREPFERALSYEPDHAISMVHLARLAAKEGRYDDLQTYARAFVELNPDADRALPIEALVAFTTGDAEEQRALLERLGTARDGTIALSIWDVLLYPRNVQGAMSIAELSVRRSRAVEARALGLAWMAHLLVAQGRWVEAQERLVELAAMDPAMALEYRALLSSLPFLAVEEGALEQLRGSLQRFDPASVVPGENPAVFFRAHDDLHALLRAYLLGLLSARLGDHEAALGHADALLDLEPPPGAGSIPADLALGIQGEVARLRAGPDAALSILERVRTESWYEPTIASAVRSSTRERFLRAEALFELGEDRAALDWYENLLGTSSFEVVYLPMMELRGGQIYQRLGEIDRAAEHYRRFVQLWARCDAELRPLVEEAKRQLDALGVEGG
jgi:tetratricopeptide (TPR) repeat protein